MDKYEELLTEKIESARNYLQTERNPSAKLVLRSEIADYQDALFTYRNLKAKGEL